MPNAWPILYRLGLDWWGDNDDLGHLPELVANRTAGLALDAGCGTGRHAVWLAEHGWTVIGVDGVEKPLREARSRAAAAGVADRARFIKDDVTRLGNGPTRPPYDLVLDIGCYHALAHDDQVAFASWVTANTREDAHVIIHAVSPRTGIGPKGIDAAMLTTAFGPAWSITTTPSTTTGGGPLRNATFRWYSLTRTPTSTPTTPQPRP